MSEQTLDAQAVKQEIARIFIELFHVRLQPSETDLSKYVDSVKVVDLVLELEQRFGVELPFEEFEVEDFQTVDRLADKIARTPQRKR